MNQTLVFMNKSQIKTLKSAYELINNVMSEINVEYEEFASIKTCLYSLNDAINYKEKNL